MKGGGTVEQSGDLEKLGDVLADPSLRKAFWMDPDGTLEREGVNKAAIPADVLTALRDLSFEELRFLGRFREHFVRAVEGGADHHELLKMV